MATFAAEVALTIALLGGLLFLTVLPVALVSAGIEYHRARRSGRALFVSAAMTAGFLAGGTAAWLSVPSDWQLPFWTTLRASVDSATYGHPVEHAAENIMAAVLFFAVAGGVSCGLAAFTATRVRSRTRLPA